MVQAEIIQEINAPEFSDFINKQKDLVIVNFYSEGSMPCLMIEPVFESLARETKNVKFIRINLDESSEVAKIRKVLKAPCIILFKAGEEIDRISDSVSEENITEMIKRWHQ